MSFSWSDNTLLRFTRTDISRSGPITHVTVQHSLLGESLSEHGTALQISGSPNVYTDGNPPGWMDVTHFSVHRNALVSTSHRNPNARGLYLELINNIVHNWNLDGGQTGRGAVVDWIGNYFQKGPMSRADRVPLGVRSQDMQDDLFGPAVYLAGNVSLGGQNHADQLTSTNADNWRASVPGSRSTAVGLVDWYHNDNLSGVDLLGFRRERRITSLTHPPAVPVAVQDAYQARNAILADVGANRRLDCRGDWVFRVDAVDQRLIDDIQAGSGISSSLRHEDAVGGFPRLSEGTRCQDTSGDGIPDNWKLRHGLDVKDPTIARRIGANGYTYIEHYLNGTSP
jgi:hypothetical protein